MHPMRELWNCVSMIPGLVLTTHWGRSTSFPKALAMVGYSIICLGSMSWHFMHWIHGDRVNMKWLKVDLVCQNVGLMLSISQSALGAGGVLMLLPCAMISLITDPRDKRQKQLAYSANATNILINASISKYIVMQWLLGFTFFGTEILWPEYANGIGHVAWHIVCHICVHQHFIHNSLN